MSLDQGSYVFETKEGDRGVTPWIHCQPTTSELSIVGTGSLAIHVKDGTPYEEVRELGKLLNALGASLVFVPPR